MHVVDNDPTMRDSLALLLGTEGLDVRLYAGGTALLDCLPKAARGTVLADIRMPGIDGLALLRRLRSAGQKLPVVMMTRHADVSLAVQAMNLGACDLIEKPFGDAALLQAMHSALEQYSPEEVGGPIPL